MAPNAAFTQVNTNVIRTVPPVRWAHEQDGGFTFTWVNGLRTCYSDTRGRIGWRDAHQFSRPRRLRRPGGSARAPARLREYRGSERLAILLAMAMFVLVVDTSFMNVSISAVVHDLHTTVSGVQSAIALEALVSAAFILIGSKVGDLIGRKRAYVLGLLGYAVGALAMGSLRA